MYNVIYLLWVYWHPLCTEVVSKEFVRVKLTFWLVQSNVCHVISVVLSLIFDHAILVFLQTQLFRVPSRPFKQSLIMVWNLSAAKLIPNFTRLNLRRPACVVKFEMVRDSGDGSTWWYLELISNFKNTRDPFRSRMIPPILGVICRSLDCSVYLPHVITDSNSLRFLWFTSYDYRGDSGSRSINCLYNFEFF